MASTQFLKLSNFIGLVLVVGLVSCENSPASSPIVSSSDVCLPPMVHGVYPIATRGPVINNPTEIAPPVGWEMQLTTEQSATLIQADDLIVRSGDEIWYGSQQFRPSTHALNLVTEKIGDALFYPSRVYLTKQGVLWGFSPIGVKGNSEIVITSGFLSRYDDITHAFAPKVDNTKILTGQRVSDITEDARGRLWLVVDGQLARYDPTTNVAEWMTTAMQGYSIDHIAFAPDDNLWFSARSATNEPEQVFRYNVSSGKIDVFGKPGTPPGAGDRLASLVLYFDRAGRLWVNDYGWLAKPDELVAHGWTTWYAIVRSPVFITDRLGGESQYDWLRPDRIMEDHKGVFWFSSVAGLANFQTDFGKWCLVTTVGGPIVEDSMHDLWLAGEGQIYKYSNYP